MKARPFWVRAGWLFDGSGRAPDKNVAIEVTDGCISRISGSFGCGMDKDAEMVDFSDCCLLPPFIDCHVHLTMSGTLDPAVRKKQIDADYEYSEPVIKDHLRDLLNHGVYAVRDGGDRCGTVMRYKKNTPELKKAFL